MSYLVRRQLQRARGLGATNDASSAGFFDDLINAGEGAVEAGRDELTGSAGEIVEKLIRSSQFKKVLDAVEDKAEKGVKDVIAENAIGIIGLAVSAGTLGGFFGRGKVGVGASVLGIGASLAFLVHVNKPKAKK